MIVAPAPQHWTAAGVRHELLARVLPTLRHELATPIATLRMALLVLKRQLTQSAIDQPACQERMALLDEQLGALIRVLHSLRDWDLGTGEAAIARAALAAQCVALMRPAFEVNGTRLEVDAAIAAQDGDLRLPSAGAPRYLCLGALGYLQDNLPQFGLVRVEADGADGLRFVALQHAANVPCVDHLPRPRSRLMIDAAALQCLADDLGLGVDIRPEAVRVSLAQPQPLS
ncbi:MAG TPA: hypothetical protein VLJ86_24250 [Ramlibacter sp.]|nr:hypothetical protein [Ramlibacter sp.]